MKKLFDTPEMKISVFSAHNIITTSGEGPDIPQKSLEEKIAASVNSDDTQVILNW